jgi:hypothetical protein
LAGLQFLIGVALSIAVGLIWGFQLGASFAVGVALVLGNLLVLAWAWWRLFEQKTIAWTLLIIVIKYAVLLGSIIILARMAWFRVLGAGLGVSSFVIAALVWAVIMQRQETEPEKEKS